MLMKYCKKKVYHALGRWRKEDMVIPLFLFEMVNQIMGEWGYWACISVVKRWPSVPKALGLSFSILYKEK